MRFLALCPCDRVIFDRNGTLSLITIMENFDLSVQTASGEKVDIPPTTVVPRDWSIYGRWEASESDDGMTFEQVFEIYWPNGDKFVESRMTMQTIRKEDPTQQTALQLMGFPVGQVGRIKIVTWIEHDKQRMIDPIECTVRVRHVPMPERVVMKQ